MRQPLRAARPGGFVVVLHNVAVDGRRPGVCADPVTVPVGGFERRSTRDSSVRANPFFASVPVPYVVDVGDPVAMS